MVVMTLAVSPPPPPPLRALHRGSKAQVSAGAEASAALCKDGVVLIIVYVACT
jgi:hypothetical protein